MLMTKRIKIRSSLQSLTPYSSARKEYSGAARILLDANENSFGSVLDDELRRYPDPYQLKLKQKLSGILGIESRCILLGNGSDEIVDLTVRLFCEPKDDCVVICPPTFAMFKVQATISSVNVKEVPLRSDFSLDIEALLSALDAKDRLLFLCSPNNPTGNLIPVEQIARLLKEFTGIVVLDEAYIDFAPDDSAQFLLKQFNNLIILRTFSKAWGLAGIRLGAALASAEIVELLNSIKLPYNINSLTQGQALRALEHEAQMKEFVKRICEQRKLLVSNLSKLACVSRVFPSDANFLLVQFFDVSRVKSLLDAQGIIVRDRSQVKGCEGCLRITVGNESENERLLLALSELEPERP